MPTTPSSTERIDYCECECGKTIRVPTTANGPTDTNATMLRAYKHYIACDVAFERAPQLIVEMARSLREVGIAVPPSSSAQL